MDKAPEVMSEQELVHALDENAAAHARLGTERLRLLAALDNIGYAERVGARDTVQFIEYRYRLDHHRARRDVQLARALPKYEAVSTQLDEGNLRPAQAEAIVLELEKTPTTVPVDDLEFAEQRLAALTHLPPIHLRKAAIRARDILDTDGPEPEEQKAAARESLTLCSVDRGVKFKGYLANENAELFRTLITTGARPHKAVDGTPDPRPREKRQADALTTALTLATTALDAGTPSPTIPRPTPPTPTPPTPTPPTPTPPTPTPSTASSATGSSATGSSATGSSASASTATASTATGSTGSTASTATGFTATTTGDGTTADTATGTGTTVGGVTADPATGNAVTGNATTAGGPTADSTTVGATTAPTATGDSTTAGTATVGGAATDGAVGGGAARRVRDCGDVVPGFGAKANITVTIDLQDLKAATADAIGQTVYSNGLSAATIRRLACDANVIPVVLGSRSEPLDVGRSERLVTRGIRRALNARDRGCVVCAAPPVMCDAHHLVAWIDGGPTALSNLVLACRRHHTEVHNGHWHITITNDAVHVARPTWADPPPPTTPNRPATSQQPEPPTKAATRPDPPRPANPRRAATSQPPEPRSEADTPPDPPAPPRRSQPTQASEPADAGSMDLGGSHEGESATTSPATTSPAEPGADPRVGQLTGTAGARNEPVRPAPSVAPTRPSRWRSDELTLAEAARFAVWDARTTTDVDTGPPSFATI